ncbi:tRNA pseudouridine(38-40) synthase TruA [Psychroflexus salis]|uniref:tRNA pseudouridine synthase A n=1 Tax=Psychroflexus salis TaxID=1526574 RepID=A0A916ZU16_9FLAO|nr:tRNA pseudouridine(38-40) synthase TruA [Psychroflexus salis]GGE12667.1 tRNA pseudouridine synthase A [Psychroflexus salis]
MKYFIQLSYFGKNYCGWQIQPDQASIQETLNEKINVALQEKVELVGSGRTDTGVHAKNYIAHFTCTTSIGNMQQFIFKLNTLLPKDIAIHNCWPVSEDAHARFSAISRSYSYWLTQEKNPFLIDQAYYVKRKVDIKLMNLAAKELKNYRNFKAFSKVKTQVYTYNCEIYYANWKELDNGVLEFNISANRFLRNMVRAIVGTLIDVGLKKISISDFKKIIESKERAKAGKSVPAKALCLNYIQYPKELMPHE